jgi:hypothetical protein
VRRHAHPATLPSEGSQCGKPTSYLLKHACTSGDIHWIPSLPLPLSNAVQMDAILAAGYILPFLQLCLMFESSLCMMCSVLHPRTRSNTCVGHRWCWIHRIARRPSPAERLL